jgi:hypothetical protein
MLLQILEEMRQSTAPVNGDDLARQLGIEKSALEGMLNQLVSQGKLRKVRQVGLDECRQEMATGKFSLYGDVWLLLELTNRSSITKSPRRNRIQKNRK